VLNEQFDIAKPIKVWVADTTYIPCREGGMWPACWICARGGWRVAAKRRMTAGIILGALEYAYCRRSLPLTEAERRLFIYDDGRKKI